MMAMRIVPHPRVVTLLQVCAWALVKIIFSPIRITRIGGSIIIPPSIRAKGLLLASNHASRLDTLLTMKAMTYQELRQILPIGFLVDNTYLGGHIGITLAAWLGMFPAYHGKQLLGGITYAQAYLDAGFTIMIYPEGQRALPHEVRARRGTAVLAQKTGAPILPVRIHHGNVRTPLYRRRVTVTFGHIHAPIKTANHQLIASHLLRTIYALEI